MFGIRSTKLSIQALHLDTALNDTTDTRALDTPTLPLVACLVAQWQDRSGIWCLAQPVLSASLQCVMWVPRDAQRLTLFSMWVVGCWR